MEVVLGNLYEAWLENTNSQFEEDTFLEPIIKRYCYWHGGTTDKVDIKGKTFNAAYEIYIYAFFLGIYANKRRPLVGNKRNFSMEMKRWGNINLSMFPDRRTYSQIQKYVFSALIAKSDIDLLAIDRGDLSIPDGVSILMRTLSEYANGGFYLMKEKMESVPDYFDGQQSFLTFISKYAQKSKQ
jgi:hypothetical protein